MAAEVLVVAGSASDLPVIRESKMIGILNGVGILSAEIHVCSAHRNAKELETLVQTGSGSEAKVLIGVAGMAAALPGALAANSGMSKPVIAVPLDEHGIDSCLYMPPGVPVALAGVGKTGLKNAGLLACQILAADDDDLRMALEDYVRETNKQPRFNVDLKEA